MNKKGLDEMQVQRRNSIGNQTFLLLLYLLLLDAGLYGLGFTCVSYPANVMIILCLCSGIYVIRSIAANAFVGPHTKAERPLLGVVMLTLVAVLASAVILISVKNAGFSAPAEIEGLSAPLLFITASVSLVIAVVTVVIKRMQDKNYDE
jgi:glucan phosphoethanolaminetransferase (alkaline phosphatase superfamily)